MRYYIVQPPGESPFRLHVVAEVASLEEGRRSDHDGLMNGNLRTREELLAQRGRQSGAVLVGRRGRPGAVSLPCLVRAVEHR